MQDYQSVINFSFFGIIFTCLLNLYQSDSVSVFSVFYFYVLCFIFGHIMEKISGLFHIDVYIFDGKYLGIQDLILSCPISLQIIYNIFNGLITDLIARLST